MGIIEDLKRNRDIYRQLAAGVSSDRGADRPIVYGDRQANQVSTVYQESGILDDRTFSTRVAEMQDESTANMWAGQQEPEGLAVRRGTEPVRYALDGPMPVRVVEVPEFKPVAFENGEMNPLQAMGWEEPAPVRPEAAGTREEREDLLDSLLQRLETSARRYPQDLTDKE